jgi:hypothetical protein
VVVVVVFSVSLCSAAVPAEAGKIRFDAQSFCCCCCGCCCSCCCGYCCCCLNFRLLKKKNTSCSQQLAFGVTAQATSTATTISRGQLVCHSFRCSKPPSSSSSSAVEASAAASGHMARGSARCMSFAVDSPSEAAVVATLLLLPLLLLLLPLLVIIV